MWTASVVPFLGSAMACSGSQAAGGAGTTGPGAAGGGDGREGFDFLRGRWRVSNRRLVARLQGSAEWQEFPAEIEGHSLLGGMANVDTLHIPVFPDGKPLEVVDLKVFDPASRTWTLVQADSRSGQLGVPLVGRFSSGRGEFFCDDTVRRQADPRRAPLERHHRHLCPLGAGLLARRRRDLGDQLGGRADPRGLSADGPVNATRG